MCQGTWDARSSKQPLTDQVLREIGSPWSAARRPPTKSSRVSSLAWLLFEHVMMRS